MWLQLTFWSSLNKKAAHRGRQLETVQDYFTRCSVSLKMMFSCPMMSERYAMVMDP